MIEDDEIAQEGDDEEEIPPDKLQNKWFKDELSFKETVCCRSCGKELPRDTLTCLFCGARVFEHSGLLGSLLAWFRKMFH